MTLPIMVLTPHQSGYLPTEILAEMLGEQLYEKEARDERLSWLFDEGDPYTDIIFHLPEAHNLHAPYSRFVVDLNRFRDQGGANGVIKLTDFEGRSLYPDGFVLSDEAREQRLRRYWDSFHQEVEASLRLHDIKLLINGHSMQPRGPVIGPDAGKLRPAITLMTNGDAAGNTIGGVRTSIEPDFARATVKLLEQHFAQLLEASSLEPAVALNDPWSMDETTFRYSDPERNRAVPGFGIEFNRALYLTYKEGKEYPNEPVIRALNEAFRAFIVDLDGLI